MKEFNFEFTNQKLLTKLLIIAFLVFVLLLFSSVHLKNNIGFLPPFALTFIIPFLIVWLNRNKIKLKGYARIDSTSLELKTSEISEEIKFEAIESYMVQIFNGTLLKMRLQNGQKIKMIANTNFCNTTEFTFFCTELESNLEKFQQETKPTLVKEKSFFERKSTFYILIATTIFITSMVFLSPNHGSRNPVKLIVPICSLLAMWSGYFAEKRRKNKG